MISFVGGIISLILSVIALSIIFALPLLRQIILNTGLGRILIVAILIIFCYATLITIGSVFPREDIALMLIKTSIIFLRLSIVLIFMLSETIRVGKVPIRSIAVSSLWAMSTITYFSRNVVIERIYGFWERKTFYKTIIDYTDGFLTYSIAGVTLISFIITFLFVRKRTRTPEKRKAIWIFYIGFLTATSIATGLAIVGPLRNILIPLAITISIIFMVIAIKISPHVIFIGTTRIKGLIITDISGLLVYSIGWEELTEEDLRLTSAAFWAIMEIVRERIATKLNVELNAINLQQYTLLIKRGDKSIILLLVDRPSDLTTLLLSMAGRFIDEIFQKEKFEPGVINVPRAKELIDPEIKKIFYPFLP